MPSSAHCSELNVEGLKIPCQSWSALPAAPKLESDTMSSPFGCLFIHSASTVFKLGANEGEALMTALAHHVLGPCVPRLKGFVTIADPPDQGVLLAYQPGIPLSSLWPGLTPAQRTTAKKKLANLVVRMRAGRFDYYGRPGGRPYVTPGDFNLVQHTLCRSRAEWDASRVRALHDTAQDIKTDEMRIRTLSRVQRGTGVGNDLVDAPVLVHGDLSSRNILVDPKTLDVTGFLDWETANVAPAYFEYVAAQLYVDQDWKPDLLDVLRDVLRLECGREVDRARRAGRAPQKRVEDLYTETLTAWNALVDVERPAQGYSEACWWTFEGRQPPMPSASKSGNVRAST